MHCEICHDPTCSKDYVCYYNIVNTVTRQVGFNPMIIDSLALATTDGSKQGPLSTINNYIFSCGPHTLLKGLPETVVGMAAFGRSKISLLSQASSAISAPAYLVMCLSGSRDKPGVAIIGSSSPYIFSPATDPVKLIFTPLLINPIGETPFPYDSPSSEYFIGLTSIKVHGKVVPINRTLLAIKENGHGGAQGERQRYLHYHAEVNLQGFHYRVSQGILCDEPHTNSICDAVRVSLLRRGCFDHSWGSAFPIIDLALDGNLNWKTYGANSMVKVISKGKYFWCLGFMDGGVDPPRTSVVIGEYRMEDNLLLFDLESDRLGLSSSLLLKGTSCANFNFSVDNYKPK